MLNRLSLKGKVLSMVIPLFVALVLSVSIIGFQEVGVYRKLGYLDRALDFTVAISGFTHQIQIERGKTSLFLTKKISKDDLAKQHLASDREFAETAQKAQALGLDFPSALQQVGTDLADARKYAFGDGAQPPESVRRYSAMAVATIGLMVKASKGVSLNGLEDRILGLSIMESSKENVGLLRANLSAILGADRPITFKDVGRIQNFRTAVSVALQSPALSVSQRAARRLDDIMGSQGWAEIGGIVDQVAERAATGSFGIPPEKAFEKTSSLIEQLYKNVKDESGTIAQDYRAAANGALATLLGTLLVGLVMVGASLGMITVITRRLVSDLGSVSEALNQSVNVSTESSMKLGESSQELSAAITEQAESLQETVASLEEVSAMVAKTATNAEQAKTVSSDASQEAKEGVLSVKEMVGAMNEIAASNSQVQSKIDESNANLQEIIKVIQEIGSRTKVINDIVFQTKLLSFNASVEAARAGVHGRGFAVVAEEVGNLARMSGDAAKEISSLLNDGSQKVETIISESKEQVGAIVTAAKNKVDAGQVTSKRCSEFFSKIIDRVSKFDEAISEIATAAKEQSQGINEISKAMNQLDTTTQQNRSATEQLSGIAGVLSQQSLDVRGNVRYLEGIIKGRGAVGANVGVFGQGSSEHRMNGSEKADPLGHPKSTTDRPSNVIAFPLPENRAGNSATNGDSQPVQKVAVGGTGQAPSGSDPGFEEV